MASLGTNRLNIVNDQPAVEKLWNGRYRLEFYCDNDGKKTDWYYTNVGNILPDFGTLQGDGFGEAPSESIAESKYADMRLVEVGTEYVPAASQHYVKLTYETLTAAWVLEKDEDTDYELNGLKRVTRQSVALPDTPYANVVGTSTITSDGTTLYLGSYKIEETDAKWMLTEVWLEAGQLSETITEPDRDGKITTTVEWFGTPPVGLSDVIASRTSEYEGLPTYQFSYVNTSTLTSGYSYVTTVPFSIPGTVTTETNGVTGIGSFTNLQLVISPPVATNVEATITIEFTTEPTVDPLVYRPASWTRTKIYGAGRYGRAFASTTTHANHIRIGSGDTISTSVTGSSVGFIQGNRVYAGTTAVCEIIGPTYDPAGKTIILSDTSEPAFILADGTQYFRRTTVVASIPSRDT